jgi:hypothetical protein
LAPFSSNYVPALQAGTWEADEIGANTEARTLARRGPDARAHNIQDGENSRSHHAEREDLVPREAVAGDKDRRNGDKETLNQVLDGAIDYLGRGVHTFYISHRDFSKGIRLSRISV